MILIPTGVLNELLYGFVWRLAKAVRPLANDTLSFYGVCRYLTHNLDQAGRCKSCNRQVRQP